MPNDASQNPTNRWARNSGVGPGGVTEVIPTPEEARRGLTPLSDPERESPGRTIALAFTTVVGALVASAAIWKARQPRPMPQRIMRKIRRR